MVRIPGDVLFRYRQFSLYNSPYAAHDRGCAIDLYPETNVAPSPVAGEVLETKTVRAPPKPYAPEHDHLILIDTDEYVARVLHVDPSVEPGDSVAVGDPLGELVRAGFFAPWVDNHVHLGFRDSAANPYRAAGSLPVDVAVPIEPLAWDGTGTVVETGETYAILDAPAHPAPGERFVGVATDEGAVIDGGLPHYDHGGVVPGGSGPVSLLGTELGRATSRDVTWGSVEETSSDSRDASVSRDGIAVRANGEPITGLSCYAARDSFGAKLVHPGHEFEAGERVDVTVERL